MNDQTAEKLLLLNRNFYDHLAEPFDRSRFEPQAGFIMSLEFLPEMPLSILDVGCGNGRFALFMSNRGRLKTYLGLDFSQGLLSLAAKQFGELDETVQFAQADMSQPHFLNQYGQYDLVACLSAMHHIPQRSRRAALLAELNRHVAPGGFLLLSNWQFMDSPRQRRKVLDWAEIGLKADDVEAGDYLLSWKRGGYGQRYACHIDAAQTEWLANEAGLKIITQYREDGRERDLTLYTIFQSQ